MNTSALAQPAVQVQIRAIERYLRWGVAVAALCLASLQGWVSERHVFLALSAVLIGYNVSEIVAYCRVHRGRRVSPVVFACVTLFLVPFGLTNLLYLLPAGDLHDLLMDRVAYRHLVHAQLLALLGSVALWFGYRSDLGRALGATLREMPMVERSLHRSFEPYLPGILACMIGCLLSRLALVRMGMFGYAAEAEQITATAAYFQYFRMGSLLGTVALVTLALAYYGTRRGWTGTLLALWTAHEMLWGFIAAFKTDVVAPLIVVGLVRYILVGRIPRAYVVGALLALVAAYAVIEPLRYLRYSDAEFDTRSVSAIAGSVVGIARSTETGVERFEQSGSVPLLIVSRMNLSFFAAHAVEYAERGPLPPGSPEFLANIALSPLYAVAPRVLLPGKAEANAGSWFSENVMGWSDRTSVAMSPVGYLAFAGGQMGMGQWGAPVLVLLIFAALGMSHRAAFEWLFRPHAGALLVYLVVLSVLALALVDEVWTWMTSAIRFIPLAMLAQAVMFRRDRYVQPIQLPHRVRG